LQKRFITPFSLRKRREIAQQYRDPDTQNLVTVNCDGSHCRVSGRGLADIDDYKSGKNGTKDKTCVNIVYFSLPNGTWCHKMPSEPCVTNLDMTVLQKLENVTEFKKKFSPLDIIAGDGHFDCFTVNGGICSKTLLLLLAIVS
jgi:hypothetical protein